MAIKKYDKERTCFERQGEYLVLQIPNLAESRPSLVVGDKLVATVPTGFGKDGKKNKFLACKILFCSEIN